MKKEVFDKLADHYDAWFDSERGAALFRAEVECLEHLMPAVDPSLSLIEMARARGIRTVQGVAEELPYDNDSLEGILLVVTLCFLDDPDKAMQEFARVLRPDGRLVVGFVPADSAWGRQYMRKGQEGHPFYSAARFYTCSEALDMVGAAGFRLLRAVSTLPMAPDERIGKMPVLDGIVRGCGFVGMLFAAGGPP